MNGDQIRSMVLSGLKLACGTTAVTALIHSLGVDPSASVIVDVLGGIAGAVALVVSHFIHSDPPTA